MRWLWVHETRNGRAPLKTLERKALFCLVCLVFLERLDLAITLEVKSQCHTAFMSWEVINSADIDVAAHATRA